MAHTKMTLSTIKKRGHATREELEWLDDEEALGFCLEEDDRSLAYLIFNSNWSLRQKNKRSKAYGYYSLACREETWDEFVGAKNSMDVYRRTLAGAYWGLPIKVLRYIKENSSDPMEVLSLRHALLLASACEGDHELPSIVKEHGYQFSWILWDGSSWISCYSVEEVLMCKILAHHIGTLKARLMSHAIITSWYEKDNETKTYVAPKDHKYGCSRETFREWSKKVELDWIGIQRIMCEEAKRGLPF